MATGNSDNQIQEKDPSYWQVHIARFKESGLSKIQYCKQTNLNYTQFLYWCDKLTKQGNPLIPIKLTNSQALAKNYCTLEFKQGHRLVIQSLEGMHLIEKILKDFR